MTGGRNTGTDALGKSPVYSPMGSSAHEVGHLCLHHPVLSDLHLIIFASSQLVHSHSQSEMVFATQAV